MELRSSVRWRTEGIELNIEVTVVPNRLRQRGRADHGRDIVDRSRRRRGCDRGSSGPRPCRRERFNLGRIDTLERRSRVRINATGILEIAIVEVEDIAGVRAMERA